MEVVSLILSGGKQVRLDATDLSNTSIKRDRKKRTLGTRIGTKVSRMKFRGSLSPQDSKRGESDKSRKKSFSWKRIGRSSSLKRSSSIKRSKSSAASLASKPVEIGRPRVIGEDPEAGNVLSPPGSSHTLPARPCKYNNYVASFSL